MTKQNNKDTATTTVPKGSNTESNVTPKQGVTHTEDKTGAKVEDPKTAPKEKKIEFTEGKLYEIHCKTRANKTLVCCTKTPVVFDEKGVAVAGPVEAEYFSHFDNCKVTNHKE